MLSELFVNLIFKQWISHITKAPLKNRSWNFSLSTLAWVIKCRGLIFWWKLLILHLFFGCAIELISQVYIYASVFPVCSQIFYVAITFYGQCAANFSSESIPNGIGFGGRVNHFGLFLSASFDKGHTFTSPTFGNCCLSKTSQVYPEVIECWGVIKGAQQERQDALKGTVLERFKEDRHMLNMVGLANSSEWC